MVETSLTPSHTRPRADVDMWKMRSLFALTPTQLLNETRALLAARAENTADLLAHLAEIDERRLYIEAAYPSMQAYCAGALAMAEDSAEKRIQAVRATRQVPALLGAIADGRLTLSAVNLLASRLTPENANELIALAARRSCADIRARLAERERAAGPMPLPELPAQSVANPRCQPDSNQVMSNPGDAASSAEIDPTSAAPPSPPKRVLTFAVPADLADAYRAALALAPYEVARDPAKAFAAMLAAWREKLEKRRFGTGARRATRRASTDSHHAPAAVRAEVWRRDGGRCTYTSDAGRRCECRDQLELDHVTPVARGGDSTVANLRLRCRAHNQLEAERTFGRGFVAAKREAARAARNAARMERDRARARRNAEQAARERIRADEAARRAAADEVMPALRQLGLGASEAREIALRVGADSTVPIEQRLLAAVRTLGPGARRVPTRGEGEAA